jgi:hypothetical protein
MVLYILILANTHDLAESYKSDDIIFEPKKGVKLSDESYIY